MKIQDSLRIGALLLLGMFVVLFLTLPGFRNLVIPGILKRSLLKKGMSLKILFLTISICPVLSFA